MACMVYEGVLLFGVLWAAGMVYGVVTQQRRALVGSTGLQAFAGVVLAAYFVYFWSRSGQTLAMLTWHIKLVTVDGERVSPLRALCRHVLAWLWFVPALATLHFAGVRGGWQTFWALALGSIGLTGLVPKSIISAYLCFFPVAIGMVKGLTSPDTMQLDLMRTYSGSKTQTFWKLRWPAAVPFLFASLKVAITISLVGAIVGELPTGAQAGLGARLLSGSYFGQTIQIWAALLYAAILATLLIALVALAERQTLKAMGARP